MKKMFAALASLVVMTGVLVASSPVEAVPASVCPIATGAEWNAKHPDKQQATDLGVLVPGKNAGPIGTDVACMPVPALDTATTTKLWNERKAGVLKASALKTMPTLPLKAKAGTAGKSVTSNKKLATCSPSNCLFHAAAIQGSLANVTSHTWTQRIAKPGLGSDGLPNGHTLAEGTVGGAAPGGGMNYVELGTTVDANVCGGTGVSPCIFVFRWNPTAGVYNGGGWVNAAGCNPCMGSSVTSWVGTSKIFSLSQISGKWWASANNQFVASINNSNWPSSNFTSGTQIDEFFEVAVGNNTMTTTPNTDMGDNKLASCSGTVQGSYFINGNYNGGTVANLGVYNSANNGASVDTSKYDVCLMPGFTNYFRGGGPGW
jgi:hypothetical protein